MYGYIYITLNLINGKIYIGQKKSNRFIKTYHGSGVRIKNAIEKYGISNFDTYLIDYYDSAEELDEAEIYWIEYFCSNIRSNGYNVATGGRNSRGVAGENHYNWHRPSHNRNKAMTEEQKNKISNSLKETYKKYGKNRWNDTQRENYFNTIKNRPEEYKMKLKEKMSKLNKGKNKGRVCVIKDGKRRKILPEQLDEFIKDGWVRPTKKEPSHKIYSPKGKIWVHKNTINKYILPEQLDEFIKDGWIKGVHRVVNLTNEQRKQMSESQKRRFKTEKIWNKGLTKKEMLNYKNEQYNHK